MRRLEIEEVGVEDDSNRKAAIARVQEGQSQVKRNMEAQDGEMFQKFTSQKSSEPKKQMPVNKTAVSTSDATGHKPESVKSDGESMRLKLTNGHQEHVKPNKTSTSPRLSEASTSPRSLAVPTTSYQFQTDYKVLKNNTQAFYEYIKVWSLYILLKM